MTGDSFWLNNEKILIDNLKKDKPCRKLGWCPYGCIVEEFPLTEKKIEGVKINCEVFGHHCPMFYNAEDLSDFGKRKISAEGK